MFGFSKGNYEAFQTSYSQYVQSVAKSDYMEVMLFKQVRQELGKENFDKFLADGIGLTAKEISILRNKLAAFNRLSDKALWETLGYSNINKILSLPKSMQSEVIQRLQSSDKITLGLFSEAYNQVMDGQLPQVKTRDSNRDSKSINASQIQRIVMETINRALSGIEHGKSQRRGQRNRNRNQNRRSQDSRRNQSWSRQTSCSSKPVFPFVSMTN